HPIEKGVSGVVLLSADEVNVIGVRREGETIDPNLIWRQNLHVAARNYLTNVEALFLPLSQDVDHIAPVRRNRDIDRIPALRNSADLHGLEIPVTSARAWLESVSRFRRFRSARRSAAC